MDNPGEIDGAEGLCQDRVCSALCADLVGSGPRTTVEREVGHYRFKEMKVPVRFFYLLHHLAMDCGDMG